MHFKQLHKLKQAIGELGKIAFHPVKTTVPINHAAGNLSIVFLKHELGVQKTLRLPAVWRIISYVLVLIQVRRLAGDARSTIFYNH